MAHPQSEMQADTANWLERATQLAKDPSAFTAAGGNAPWSSSFWACFSPFGLCCEACWCPCITFGKTHHRLHKHADLAGYKTLNASCLTWCLFSCGGLYCIPSMLQRSDIRMRAQPQLKGSFGKDFLKTWCCPCCDLMQQEKETRRVVAAEQAARVEQQPEKMQGMSYGVQ